MVGRERIWALFFGVLSAGCGSSSPPPGAKDAAPSPTIDASVGVLADTGSPGAVDGAPAAPDAGASDTAVAAPDMAAAGGGADGGAAAGASVAPAACGGAGVGQWVATGSCARLSAAPGCGGFRPRRAGGQQQGPTHLCSHAPS